MAMGDKSENGTWEDTVDHSLQPNIRLASMTVYCYNI